MFASLLVACALVAVEPSSAETQSYADEDPQVLFRRALYDFSQGDYGAARVRLEALLNPPRLSSEDDLVEARKTLGTLYFLRGEEKRAREQFELVLLVKNDAALDVYSTAPPVLRFFDLVRAEIRGKAGELVRVFEMRKNRFEAPRIIERRQVKNSELLAFFPFGVGQFQNGNVGLGVLFLATEVLTLGANVLGYIMGALLAGPNGIVPPERAGAQIAWWAVQYTGLGAFVGAWVTGAVQARLAFAPVTTIDRDITPSAPAKTVGMQISLQF